MSSKKQELSPSQKAELIKKALHTAVNLNKICLELNCRNPNDNDFIIKPDENNDPVIITLCRKHALQIRNGNALKFKHNINLVTLNKKIGSISQIYSLMKKHDLSESLYKSKFK